MVIGILVRIHIDNFDIIYNISISFQRNRPVPILLPEDTAKPLEYLADPKVRAASGIRENNHFLFASAGTHCYICCSNIMEIYVQKYRAFVLLE